MVENYKSYIIHFNIKDVVVYNKYGYQPYIITTNETTVIFHKLDLFEGHIAC